MKMRVVRKSNDAAVETSVGSTHVGTAGKVLPRCGYLYFLEAPAGEGSAGECGCVPPIPQYSSGESWVRVRQADLCLRWIRLVGCRYEVGAVTSFGSPISVF